MRSITLLAVLLVASIALVAQTASTPAPVKEPVMFDVNAMDKAVNPCDNFYEYACGGWRKANPIPSDKARWGRFNELAEYNLQVLHNILETAAAPGKHTPIEQKVGDMYASCMDEKSVNAAGTKALQPYFARIANVNGKAALIQEIAYLHSQGISALFGFGAGPDMHDSNKTIAFVGQGGLSLPDRDYYIKDDPKSKETREKYVEHLTNMFKLLGEKPEQAAANANTILALETKLAQNSMERVWLRDPRNRDNRMKVAELQAAAPNFNFVSYFASTGAPKFTELNVSTPEYFKKTNAVIDSVPVDDWKTYLRWRVLRNYAPLLSDPFFLESFNFNNKYMAGAKEPEVRWKRCTRWVDNNLGEALGQIYVDKNFGSEGKERSLKMIQAIEKAMGKNIDGLDWMGEETMSHS